MSNTPLEYEIDDGSRPRGSLGDFWVKFPVPDEVGDRHREALTAAGFPVKATEEVLMSIDKDGSISPDHSGSAVLRGYEESIVAHFDGELKSLAGKLAAERMNVEFYKYDGDISQDTWGVDLKVPGHMIGSFESAFEEEEDREVPQKHMLVVHVDENGDVELGQGYESGVWHDFENELFSEYEDVLKAKAAEMTEPVEKLGADAPVIPSPSLAAADIRFVRSKDHKGRHEHDVYTVTLPADWVEQKLFESEPDAMIGLADRLPEVYLDVYLDKKGDIQLELGDGQFQPRALEQHVFDGYKETLQAASKKIKPKNTLTRPRPGIRPPGERKQSGRSMSM